jgi:hypothetical protein
MKFSRDCHEQKKEILIFISLSDFSLFKADLGAGAGIISSVTESRLQPHKI